MPRRIRLVDLEEAGHVTFVELRRQSLLDEPDRSPAPPTMAILADTVYTKHGYEEDVP